MDTFLDPRSDPSPERVAPAIRVTEDPDELQKLHDLCRDGRLYAVERWIQDGRPLQLVEGRPPGRRRFTSALQIALEEENHALVHLLLCNGYDPDREYHSSLNLALGSRRWDLLDLLLEWGADPHRVSLTKLFGTYQSDLFERFRTLGVDLTANHALAETLAYHTSNKPLFGFARRHRKDNPKIQRELNLALAHHGAEGNEKGVALSLWAGADPHAPACNLRWGCACGEDEDEAEQPEGSSAIERACRNGNVEILERLEPDPERDDFEELFAYADSGVVVEFLAEIAVPEDADAVIRRHLWEVCFNFGRTYSNWSSLTALRRLFEVGLRWEESSKEDLGNTRRLLIKARDQTLIDAMKLLATKDYCAPEIRYELARTKAIRRRMKEVGFIPSDDKRNRRSRHARARPTRSREVLKKFGVGISKKSKRKTKKKPLPQAVHIGRWRAPGRGIRMDREELFERVWSTPLYKLAEEWGLSGTGLRKACRRLQVPTPGRGYWQKVKAGKKVRRPSLPELPDGEAEEVVVWTPR